MRGLPFYELQLMAYEVVCAVEASACIARQRVARPLLAVPIEVESHYIEAKLTNIAIRVRSLDKEARLARAGYPGWKDTQEIGSITFSPKPFKKPRTQLCTIRNACNKLLHADSLVLERSPASSDNLSPFTGSLRLCGEDDGCRWECSFGIQEFCDAAVDRAFGFPEYYPPL